MAATTDERSQRGCDDEQTENASNDAYLASYYEPSTPFAPTTSHQTPLLAHKHAPPQPTSLCQHVGTDPENIGGHVSRERPADADDGPVALQNACSYLNHELAAFGCPSPLPFESAFGILRGKQCSDGAALDAAVGIVDCFFTVLQQRQKDLEYRNEAEQRLKLLTDEVLLASDGQVKLKGNVELADREIASLNAKLSAAESLLKEQENRNRLLREEMKMLKFNMQSSKTQYIHELRKREAETRRLKERLQKTIADQYKHAKIGLKLASPLTPGPHLATSARSRSKDEEMYQMVLGNYETRAKELMAENDLLRTTLCELRDRTSAFVKSAIQNVQASISVGALDGDTSTIRKTEGAAGFQVPAVRTRTPSSSSAVAEDKIRSKMMKMPFAMVQDAIVRDIHSILEDLAAQWENRPSVKADRDKAHADAAEKDQLVNLRKDLEKCQFIIGEQSRLLEMWLDPDAGVSLRGKSARGKRDRQTRESEAGADEGMSDSEVALEKELLSKRKRELEQERSGFTEACIRLAKERAAFQEERKVWNESRRAQETQNVLSEMPDTPAVARITRSLQDDRLAHAKLASALGTSSQSHPKIRRAAVQSISGVPRPRETPSQRKLPRSRESRATTPRMSSLGTPSTDKKVRGFSVEERLFEQDSGGEVDGGTSVLDSTFMPFKGSTPYSSSSSSSRGRDAPAIRGGEKPSIVMETETVGGTPPATHVSRIARIAVPHAVHALSPLSSSFSKSKTVSTLGSSVSSRSYPRSALRKTSSAPRPVTPERTPPPVQRAVTAGRPASPGVARRPAAAKENEAPLVRTVRKPVRTAPSSATAQRVTSSSLALRNG